MIAAGESLGTRYAVSTAPEESRTGALFEVVDRSSAVVLGQLLSEVPVTPAQVAEVRAELSAVPALPTLVRPRELVLSARSLPVAILDRPGIVLLRSRVAVLAVSQGKRPFVESLLRWIAAVAGDLSVAHQANAIHGGITSRVLVSNPRSDAEACLLAGFGIGAFANRVSPGAPGTEPTKRRDLTDLLGALHDLFLVAGVQPEGSAAAKWTLLRHSAMHGEHPALASGTALAAALNEIASLPDDADAKPTAGRATGRMATMAPPPSRQTGRSTTQPAGRSATQPGGRSNRPTERPAPPTAPRFSPVIVGVGIAAIVAVAGGVGYVLWRTAQEARSGQTATPVPRPHRAVDNNALDCPGETTLPLEALHPEGGAQEYDGVCSDGNGAPRMTVVARTGTTVMAATRPARRGQHFSAPAVLGHGAVELGSALALPDADWVSWRNGVGVPVGLARIDGHGALPVEVGLPGWDAVPLRGAIILHATARDVFLVTNVESEGGAHPVLLDVALAPTNGRPPVTTWYLGSGVVNAAIPGDTPTLLLHLRGNGHHELSALTVRLGLLVSARSPAEPASVRGANPPDNAVERSATLTINGEALAPVPHGALPGRSFLVTVGAARTSEPCPTPGRCVGAGAVTLVSFPPQGSPVARELSRNAWAEDLVGTGGEGLQAVYVLATPSGAPATVHTTASLTSITAEPQRAALVALGSPHARLALCGTDPWMVFDATAPEPGVAALPLACLHPMR